MKCSDVPNNTSRFLNGFGTFATRISGADRCAFIGDKVVVIFGTLFKVPNSDEDAIISTRFYSFFL